MSSARTVLADLLQLERETVELALVRRTDALDRVSDAIRRIGDLGSPGAILGRAAAELGECTRFDCVLLSQVRERQLVPRGVWVRDDDGAADRLDDEPIALEYPLVEAEVVRQQRSQALDVATGGSRSPTGLRELLGWSTYAVAPLTLRGGTIGLLHAGRVGAGDPVGELEVELASIYADGLAGAFERAALRLALRQHRDELRAALSWMEGHLAAPGIEERPEPAHVDGDLLTPRELEVLDQLAKGRTNDGIAKALLISESTVKFHVKNILGKLGASSRADAVARHMRREG